MDLIFSTDLESALFLQTGLAVTECHCQLSGAIPEPALMPARAPNRMPQAQCGHGPSAPPAPHGSWLTGPHRAAQPTLQSAYWYFTQAFFLLKKHAKACAHFSNQQVVRPADLQIRVYQDAKPVRSKNLMNT